MECLHDDFKDACDNTEGEVVFYEKYTGRDMGFRSCFAIIGTSSNCQKIVAEVIKSRPGNEYTDKLMDYSIEDFGPDDVIFFWPKMAPQIDS